MKKLPASRHFRKLASFTLVELLVVIAIIAILAGVLLAAGNSAIHAAKQAKAANMANQIQTAVLGYYTEYSVYPVGAATTASTSPANIGDTSASAANWGALLQALCGNVHPSTGLAVTPSAVTNSRGINFLTLRSSDVDTSDAPLNPLPTGNSIYFNIVMDAEYCGVIGATPSSYTTLPKFTPSYATSGGTTTSGVAIWANCNGTLSKTNYNWFVHTY